MCDKVNVMYERSMNLRRLKYDTPKDQQNQNEIQFLIDDIQSLAREVGNDVSPYNKQDD
jgi:hypothetical protein